MDSTVSVDNTPYAVGCNAYWEQGWVPLPLPPGKKSSPPSAYTGREGKDPTREQINAWRQGQPVNRHPVGNICLRMTNYVIGIDVDNYGDKSGAATLAEAQRRWGALPPTYASSARELPSGIRFYRVPGELAFKGYISFTTDDGELLNGIEIIQRSHRYAVVWPSTNPDAGGAPYLWYAPDGTLAERPPNADTLPYLPDEWVRQLHVDRDLSVSYTANFESFVSSLEGPDEEPCDKVAERVATEINDIRNPPQARHDTARDAIMKMFRLGDQGHTGIMTGLEQIREVFINEVSGDEGSDGRPPDEAESEWDRMLYGGNGLGEIQAAPTPDAERVCLCGNNDLVDTSVGVGASSGLDQSSSATSDNDDEFESDLEWERKVASKLYELQANREAKRRADIEEARKLRPEWPEEFATISELINSPDEDNGTPVIEGLWTRGGFLFVEAQKKSGKTTTMLNILRSLADGEPLFSEHISGGLSRRAVLIDTELPRSTLKRWFSDADIDNKDVITPLSYVGAEALLDVRDEDIRQIWIDKLRSYDASMVILDCISPVLQRLGLEENSNTEVGNWVVSFREVLYQAGVEDGLCMVHHMGHGEERSRGASALEDRPDSIMRLKLEDKDDPESQRFYEAFGRDIDIPSTGLTFDPRTRRLSVDHFAGSLKEARQAASEEKDAQAVENLLDGALEAVKANPGMSKGQFEKYFLKGKKEHRRRALAKLVEDGLVRADPGGRNGVYHYPTTP